MPLTLRSVLEVTTPEMLKAHQLSKDQWSKILAHQAARDSPVERRLARLDGVARTVFSNYRRAPLLYSEFVPVDDHVEPRFFSPREMARIQGFPERFCIDACGKDRLNRVYHQLGNAVCPPVVSAVLAAVCRTGAFGDAKRGAVSIKA